MALPHQKSGDSEMQPTRNVNEAIPGDAPEAEGPAGLGIRHLQTLLMFLGLSIAYMLRVNMSVAIVAMSNSTAANPDMEDFGWDSSTQSVILSSFFWGYVVTQIPSGHIAHVWSASKLWSVSMFTCGVVNILIPVAASYSGWMAVCACRVIMGLCQGCIIPCIHTLLGKWVPPSEIGRLGTYAHAGYHFGTIVGLPISGFLAASPIGWPSIFYIVGAITIIWSIVFFIWGADSPAQYRGIKPAEKDYIEESLGQVDVKEQLPVPWKLILTSVPMWALIIVQWGQNWGGSTLLTEIPTYMNAVLLFDISKNGLLSALPYLTAWLLSFPASSLFDYVLKRRWVTRTVARKIANSIGHWGPAIALICLGFTSSDNTVVAIVVLVFSVGLNSATFCGFQTNHIDLSPNFAGTLMAITNCSANIMSLIAPLFAGLIITDSSDVTQWRTVFFISAGIYFLFNLVFILFGQAEVQSWNEPQAKQNSDSGKNSKAEETSEQNKTEKQQ